MLKTAHFAAALAALIGTSLALVAASGCGTESTVETVERPESCDHRGFSCNPRDPGADESCSIRCNDSPMHCKEYTWDMIEWCDRYPGTYYHGNPGMKCSYSLWGGDPLWNMPCLPGWQPVAPDGEASEGSEARRAFESTRPARTSSLLH